jgi:hypothetical protein
MFRVERDWLRQPGNSFPSVGVDLGITSENDVASVAFVPTPFYLGGLELIVYDYEIL